MYEEIKPYIEKGLVSEQVHPENPDVRIFNYTQTCQFSKAWDEVTVQCRGLIMNVETGEILARPFPKFFNHGEHIGKGLKLPEETPVISEKLDGSLGILYALQGVPWIATRGSFTSDQAKWATNWWRKHVGMLPNDDHTNLFEIIYPENRIVVNYDFSGLVHLITLSTSTKKPVHMHWGDPVRKAKTIEATDLETLCKMDTPNSEGFVVHYPTSDLRLKIKFPEYVRLHKIVTGVSEIGIWESLKEGKGIGAFIDKVPDEFFKWATNVAGDLQAHYLAIENETKLAFEDLTSKVVQEHGDNAPRKFYAEKFKNFKSPGLLFAMLDKQDYSQTIWKMVRPHGKSIFKTDIDQ